MAREKTGYRDNLALLNERFPGKDVLTRAYVARFTGSCYRTVKRRYRFNEFGEISKADLARQITV